MLCCVVSNINDDFCLQQQQTSLLVALYASLPHEILVSEDHVGRGIEIDP